MLTICTSWKYWSRGSVIDLLNCISFSRIGDRLLALFLYPDGLRLRSGVDVRLVTAVEVGNCKVLDASCRGESRATDDEDDIILTVEVTVDICEVVTIDVSVDSPFLSPF